MSNKENLEFAEGSLELNDQEIGHLLVAFVCYKAEHGEDDFTEDGKKMMSDLEGKLYKLHYDLGLKTRSNPKNQKLMKKWHDQEVLADAIGEAKDLDGMLN